MIYVFHVATISRVITVYGTEPKWIKWIQLGYSKYRPQKLEKKTTKLGINVCFVFLGYAHANIAGKTTHRL